jgi:hypothetical protein
MGNKTRRNGDSFITRFRQQEFKYLVPTVCAAAQKLQEKIPDIKFLIPVPLALYEPKMRELVAEYGLNAVIMERDQTLEAIAAADLAVAKSGTVKSRNCFIKGAAGGGLPFKCSYCLDCPQYYEVFCTICLTSKFSFNARNCSRTITRGS